MAFSVERNGFTDLQAMCYTLSQDLVANGFTMLSADGSTGASPQPTSASYVVKATTDVDPHADEQEWCICVFAEDALDRISFNILPYEQLIDDVTPASLDSSRLAGQLSLNNDKDLYFFHRNNTWSLPATQDPEAHPLSYFLSISDHGIAFMMWAEGLDEDGNKFAWWHVARPVDEEGLVDTGTTKKPLLCIFSHDGGGSEDANEVMPEGILKYTVREEDINAATAPVSAVVPTPDSHPIINPIQQVGIREGNKFVMFFPQGLNTSRYVYEWKLDLIAYTSADVISMDSVVSITMFDEDQPRQYRAMKANSKYNKGMRLMLRTYA